MKISGFSFGRNTSKLYYPIKESILSVLPICHEFIFVLGKGDEDDLTLEILESINSPKLKIIKLISVISKHITAQGFSQSQYNTYNDD